MARTIRVSKVKMQTQSESNHSPSLATRFDPAGAAHDDVERANYLLLTTRWESFKESNASSRYGPPLANTIVQRDFCTIASSGTYPSSTLQKDLSTRAMTSLTPSE